MKNKRIYFRADASASIGYGHFTRTLALADMLKNDFECIFYTVSPTEYQVGEMEKVCKYVALDAESPLDVFLDLLQGDEIVVLDNYFYTSDYQLKIKSKGCKLVCIDDLHDKHYYADVVINHGVSDISLFDVEPYTILCLGYAWALLRKPFLSEYRRVCNNSISNIVICFGGSDMNDFTGKTIQSLIHDNSIQSIKAIVGDAYQKKVKLSIDDRIEYFSRQSAEQMASLFRSADLVICSASSVCLEALACGAKVAAGWYVDNQKDFYLNLCNLKLIQGLGNLNKIEVISIYFNSFRLLNFNNDFSSIPGKYIKVFKQLTNNIYLREVNDADIDLLFEWANDTDVRANSFSYEPIKYENHVLWFNHCLKRCDVLIYILLYNDKPAGVVRLNVENTSAVISYSISKEFRCKGLGEEIIRLVEQKARTLSSLKELIAYVKPENIASRKIFYRGNYKEVFDKFDNRYKYTKLL